MNKLIGLLVFLVVLIIGVILNAENTPPIKFKVGDNIEVSEGFFKGCTGVLINRIDKDYVAVLQCGEILLPDARVKEYEMVKL